MARESLGTPASQGSFAIIRWKKLSYRWNEIYSFSVAPSHQYEYQILKVAYDPVNSVMQFGAQQKW